jgi:hypothetical protein
MADLSAVLYGSPSVQQPTAQPTQQPVNIPPSKMFSSSANLDLYNNLNDDIKPMINSVAEGRSPSVGRYGLDKNFMTKLMLVANQIDPTLDGTTFKARQKTRDDYSPGGVTGKKMVSINAAMAHLDNLEQNFGALNNGDTPWLNSAENSILNNNVGGIGGLIRLGGKVKQTQQNLGAANRNISDLSGELANAFRTGGGMSESDIKRELEGLNVNQSPSGMKGNITAAIHDLHGKFQPMVDAYNQTMGTNKTVSDFLEPKAKEVYDRVMNGGFGDVPKTNAPPTDGNANTTANKPKKYNMKTGKIEYATSY